MVSAKTNAVSNKQIIRNKDGSIRKQMGRKPQFSTIGTQARGSVSEGNLSHTSSTHFTKNISNKSTKSVEVAHDEEMEEDIVDPIVEADAPVGRQIMNDFMNMTQNMFQEIQARMESQSINMENKLAQIQTQLVVPPTTSKVLEYVSTRPQIPAGQSINNRQLETVIAPALDSTNLTCSKDNSNTSKISPNEIEQPRGYNRMAEICGYKMKIQIFNGSANEDYDVWWENLCAFFDLYPFNEADKVRLFNAHLGGEARKYVFNVNLRTIATVAELNEIFRKTFSDKYDWHNILMTMRQRADEKIRPYSIRLRIAATKVGFAEDSIDKTLVNYLKSTSLPMFQPIMSTCLPNTPFDVIVEHAIQFERAQELKTELDAKKNPKRKVDELYVMDGDEGNLEKRIKHDCNNSIKQIKDNMNTNFSSLSNTIKQQQDSINSLGDRLTSTVPNRTSSTFGKSPSGDKRLKVCFHCAKPSHSFNDCRSASQTDKNSIANSLAEKKFDFVKLRERANALAICREKRFNDKPNSASLNSTAPKQFGNC